MCVGCRQRAAKSDLLRVAVVGDRLAPDPGGRLPGRGAHLHLDQGCFDLAVRRRAFARALRLAEPPDVTSVQRYVAEHRHAEQQHAGHDKESRDGDEPSMSSSR
jgi:predicted RNA-binding protein YlxR (DUF448 family)